MLNKKIIIFFSLIAVLGLLQGCFLLSSKFGPGYIVIITVVDNNTVLNSDDIAQLEALAKSEQFNKVKEVARDVDNEIAVYYHRELRYSDSVEHKFIGIVFVYTNNERDHAGNRILKYIKIMNIYEGYREPLKAEIDRTAKLFEDALKKQINRDYVQVEKARTGPPM